MSKDRFGELYGRFDKLVAYLRGRGHSEDAEDLAQNAMLDTWSRLDNINEGAEWSYTKTTARSRGINQATRTPPSEELDEQPAKSPSAEDELLVAEFHRRFREVLGELPRITRLIFVRRNQGVGFAQIAIELDIDPTAARSRVSRALPMLRERLGDPPPGVKWLEFGDDE